jgi:PAS domain S-box-containing protein
VPDEGRSTAPDTESIRSFAENSLAAIVVLAGPSHRIIYANPAFCSAAARAAEALCGVPVSEAFPHLRASGHLDGLDRLRAGGQSWTCRGRPLRLPLEEGEPRVWDIEATPLHNGGVVTGQLLQLRDVSAQRRAEAALQDALAAHQALARAAEHRIKNSLQLVASLLRLQAAHMAEPVGRSAVEAATARVLAVAEAHRALQRSPDFRKVRVSDLLDELAAGAAVQHPGADLRTEAAEELTLDAERAIPLALVLAELVEDAARRAADQQAAPAEAMRLSARPDSQGMMLIEFVDGGGAAPARDDGAPDLSGKVVRALVRQIDAVLETERLPDGSLRTALLLPMRAVEPVSG